MGNVAKKKTTASSEDDVQRYLAIFDARQQFVSAALSMGWQLAITILVPVFIGVKIDAHFKTAPSYTLAALFLAIGGAIMVVAQTIKQVNESQAEAAKQKENKS